MDDCHQMFKIPPAFEPSCYRRRYADLASLKRSELREHWRRHGRSAGRNAAPFETWDELLNCLQPAQQLLEIGPFDNPALERLRRPGLQIDYADFFDQGQLMERARQIEGRDPGSVPPIRYVLSQGGYGQIEERYDAVVSQHCLEHQPDLIDHLLQVSRILKPEGVYLCSVPNQLRCFDRYLPPTNLINILTAHLEHRTKPPLEAVIEHRCFTVQDWREAPNPLLVLASDLRDRLNQALHEYVSSDYVDVHCWKFTAESLRSLIVNLVMLGYLPPSTILRTFNLGRKFALAIAFSSDAHALF